MVDLAWLRSTPWRERIAAAFDSPRRRPDLTKISGVTVRHREDSLASGAAVLRLAGLAAGLGAGRAGAGPRALERHRAHAPAGHQAHAAAGRDELAGPRGRDDRAGLRAAVALDRAPGGLRAMRRDRDGTERSWTVMGASRGEGGILGEGVRQALLRDPTYRPALQSAEAMVV